MAKNNFNKIYKEIRDSLFDLHPVCEVILDDNFALGSVLIKYRYIKNLQDFYNKCDKGHIKIATSGDPLVFEPLKGLDDKSCLRKKVFGACNNFIKGFAIVKMGDSKDNLILLHVRRHLKGL